jgi:hypothetical protein
MYLFLEAIFGGTFDRELLCTSPVESQTQRKRAMKERRLVVGI